MGKDLIEAIANLDEERAIAIVREKMSSGETAYEIVEQCKKGVEMVGKRYSEGSYYLSDLIMSAEILKEIMVIIEPYFYKNVAEFTEGNGAQIIIGTIEGDIHDLGKNIVIYLLRSSGYRVHDLGVDVSPTKFLEAIKETGATVIGVCVLLTFCIGYVKEMVDLLVEAGLRDDVKIVLGGYPVNEQVKEYTGVDYISNDAVKAMKIFKQITAGISPK